MLTEGNYTGYCPRAAYLWNPDERERVCVVCGKSFKTHSRTQKYCSQECKQAAKEARS